jgi:hypothetical protein
MKQRQTTISENDSAPQPSVERPQTPRSYSFGPGWGITRSVVSQMWMDARLVRGRWIDHAATVRYAVLDSFFLIRYWAWLVIAGMYAAAWLQYLPVIVLLTLFCLVHTALLCLCVAISLPAIIALSVIDALAMGLHGGSALYCPACYRAIAAPAYLCPLCKAVHAPPLRPNTYGMLWQRCNTCRARLATLDLLGRKRLLRTCPHCHAALPAGIGGERQVHIALVGGVAAGKTSYLVMELHALQQAYTQNRSCTITILDTEQARYCEQSRRLLQSNKALPATSASTSTAYMLKLQPARPSPPRLAYIYDPSGEVFRSSAQVMEQAYYRLCNGIIFVVNPLTIPAFYHRHIAPMQPELRPPGLHLAQTYERMMQALEACGALRQGKRSPIVVEVIVSHIDLLDLANEIGLAAAIALTSQDPTIGSIEDALHRLTRAFLCTYGMEHIVRDMELHFAHVHYCSYSAIEPSLAHKGAATRGPLARLLEQCGAFKA